jgi:hypothetical protein
VGLGWLEESRPVRITKGITMTRTNYKRLKDYARRCEHGTQERLSAIAEELKIPKKIDYEKLIKRLGGVPKC